MLWWDLAGIWYQGVYYWPFGWILGSEVLLQGPKTHLMLREINNKSAQRSAYELSTRLAATLLILKFTPKANSRPPGIKSQPNLTTACVKGQKVSLKKSWVDDLSRFLMDFPWKWTYFESSWVHIWSSRGHRNPTNEPWYQISNNSLKIKPMEELRWYFNQILYQFSLRMDFFWVFLGQNLTF